MPTRERRIVEQIADSPEWWVLCRDFSDLVHLYKLELKGQDPASTEKAPAVKVFRKLGITTEELSTVFVANPADYWGRPPRLRPKPKVYHSFAGMAKCHVRNFDREAWLALARLARRRIVVVEPAMYGQQKLLGIYCPNGRCMRRR
mgnify:CR=1 FL=1